MGTADKNFVNKPVKVALRNNEVVKLFSMRVMFISRKASLPSFSDSEVNFILGCCELRNWKNFSTWQ